MAAFPRPWNMPFLGQGIVEPHVNDPLIPARDVARDAPQVAQAPVAAPQDHRDQGRGQGRDRRRPNLLLRGLDFANVIHDRLRPRP